MKVTEVLLLLTCFLITSAGEEPPPSSTTKGLPLGYVSPSFKLPVNGWALSHIHYRYPNPQDESNLCQNLHLIPNGTAKPFFPYLCDPHELLPQNAKINIARNLAAAAKKDELCNVNATEKCGGLKVGVAVINAILTGSGDDLNSYAIAFGRVLLSKWEHMGSKCNGGLLVLVSVKDSLVYVASVNNATNCNGGCATLPTDGSPRYFMEDWLSYLEKTVESYAHACEVQRHVENTTMWEVEYTASTMREVEYTASTMREVEYAASTMWEDTASTRNFTNGEHECCQKPGGQRWWLPCLFFVLLLVPILPMAYRLWCDWERKLFIQLGTLLIEIGVLVLAVVLVWYFYLPIGIIGPVIGFVVAILCMLLLPRVVRVCRVRRGLILLMHTLEDLVSTELNKVPQKNDAVKTLLSKLSEDWKEAIREEIGRIKRELSRNVCCRQVDKKKLKEKLDSIRENLQVKFEELSKGMVEDLRNGELKEAATSTLSLLKQMEGEQSPDLDAILITLKTELQSSLNEVVTRLDGDDKKSTAEHHPLESSNAAA